MKRNFLMILIIGTMLLAISPAANAGALLGNETVTIQLDGFIDGLKINFNPTNGTAWGSRTNLIPFTKTTGFIVADSMRGLCVILATTQANGSGCFLYEIDDSPQKWTVRSPDGFFNSGTYTVVAPGAGAIPNVQMGPISTDPLY